MTTIDNLNTKPVQQILMEVRERFSNRANWQTNSLSSHKGCMCLLGGLSVAEGIITVDDYKSHYEMGCLTVGEFPNQAAIYRALGKSRALQFLMDDIATDNSNIAFVIKADKDGMHYVDAAWTSGAAPTRCAQQLPPPSAAPPAPPGAGPECRR